MGNSREVVLDKQRPKLQGISLNLSAAAFSDLFFNHEHPERDRLYKGDNDFEDGEERAALIKDAMEFCSIIGYSGDTELAEQLADDFLDRV